MRYAISGFFIVVLLTVALLAHMHLSQKDHAAIEQWATQSGYSVVEIHTPGLFETQPFWFHDDNDRIYLATLRDRLEKDRVSGFKFNLFGMDQKWK